MKKSLFLSLVAVALMSATLTAQAVAHSPGVAPHYAPDIAVTAIHASTNDIAAAAAPAAYERVTLTASPAKSAMHAPRQPGLIVADPASVANVLTASAVPVPGARLRTSTSLTAAAGKSTSTTYGTNAEPGAEGRWRSLSAAT